MGKERRTNLASYRSVIRLGAERSGVSDNGANPTNRATGASARTASPRSSAASSAPA